jgi:hypothetical protein
MKNDQSCPRNHENQGKIEKITKSKLRKPQGENHEKREKHENREKHEKREINTKNALMATKSAPTAPKKHEQREFSKMHTRSHRKRARKCPRLPGKRHIPWKTYVFFVVSTVDLEISCCVGT